MKLHHAALGCAIVAAALMTPPSETAARPLQPRAIPLAEPDAARVIVTYRDQAALLTSVPLAEGAPRDEAMRVFQRRADRLSERAGVNLRTGRAISPRAHVLQARGISSEQLASRLAALPDVAHVSIDARKRIRMVPNDPLYTSGATIDALSQTGGPAVGQWYLKAPTTDIRSAINATAAWDLATGNGVVVAVLDTGVLSGHVDLQGRLLSGYDFINDLPTANDGDLRDADPGDPGDWITSTENARGTFANCGVEDSSWHGTKVSGIIGAATNNGIGMAGIAHSARLLPVRVLGKCGGYDSDIQAAMRWAAGISVPGVPANTTPAQVINLSLGSDGSCSQAYRDTVSEVTAKGTVIVAAAGNSSGRAVGTPANCPGVIAVAGLRHAGTKVGFSDLGPEIAIAAPGGNCVNTTAGTPCLYPIVTLSNPGKTAPLAGSSTYTDAFSISVGTSFSSPIVAGTVALMLSAKPGLTPTEIRSLLQSTAAAFPTSGADNGPNDATPVTTCQAPTSTDQLQCYCTTALCGAGMLDAAAATRAAAQGLFARITSSPASPQAGDVITLSSTASLLGTGRSAVGWNWTLLSGGGVVSAFTSATNAATATLQPTAAGTVTVRLTLTDDQGRTSTADTTLTVSAATTPTTPSTGSSGGGGGAVQPGWLFALAILAWLLARARRRA